MTTPRFAEIRVHGTDALAFLHGQLASDIRAIDPGHWRFGSYCAADGRVQALMLVASATRDDWRLLLPADLCGAVTQRLQRYRLRARCAIEAVEVGLAGSDVDAQPGAACYQCAAFEWRVTAPADMALPPVLWTQQLRLGIPWIVAATSERFLPQMLALERLHAYSLRKGCFPGQEIVARTHYLGRSKRRLVRLTTAAGEPAVAPGSELLDADGGQPSGTLIAHAEGSGDALAVVAENAVAGLRVKVADTERTATFVIEGDAIETFGDGGLNGRFHPPFSAWHSAC